MGIVPDKSTELLQGTLEVLVLKTLTRGNMHGYAIADWIHNSSGQALKVEEGALYPALHRLEARGLLASSWGVSDTNRRAKYYTLTRRGRRRLEQTSDAWRRTRTAIDRVLEAT